MGSKVKYLWIFWWISWCIYTYKVKTKVIGFVTWTHMLHCGSVVGFSGKSAVCDFSFRRVHHIFNLCYKQEVWYSSGESYLFIEFQIVHHWSSTIFQLYKKKIESTILYYLSLAMRFTSIELSTCHLNFFIFKKVYGNYLEKILLFCFFKLGF